MNEYEFFSCDICYEFFKLLKFENEKKLKMYI